MWLAIFEGSKESPFYIQRVLAAQSRMR